jgi:hypothetical protein
MKIQASLLSKIIPEYYTSQAWLDTEKKPSKYKKKYMISYNPSQNQTETLHSKLFGRYNKREPKPMSSNSSQKKDYKKSI